MSEMKMKKQFSNVVVVEEINKKLVNYQIGRLRKHLGLSTNKKFEFFTSHQEAVQGCKREFKDIKDDELYQASLKDDNKVDKAVTIYYKANGSLCGFLYLLEINE